jgi:hypothetical protein
MVIVRPLPLIAQVLETIGAMALGMVARPPLMGRRHPETFLQ